jgi:hypothetical protein
MKHTTTISLTLRARSPVPETRAELHLGEGRSTHRFVADQEQHELKITQDLEEGQHNLFLHFRTPGGSNAALQIIGMRIQGVPLYSALRHGCYRAWGGTQDPVQGTLDMAGAGTWIYPVNVPAHTKYWGVGFA